MFRRSFVAAVFVVALMIQTTCEAWCIMSHCEEETKASSCHRGAEEKKTKDCGHRQVLEDSVQAKRVVPMPDLLAVEPIEQIHTVRFDILYTTDRLNIISPQSIDPPTLVLRI